MIKLACRFFALFIVFWGNTVYSGNGSGAGPPAPAGKQALVQRRRLVYLLTKYFYIV
jgi:hypothetical protein